MAALECLTHQFDVADALEAVVGSAIGQVHEVRHEIALHVFGVDEMRQAEFARQLLPRRVEVDADDHVGSRHTGALNHVETDATKAEHDYIGAGLDLRSVDYGTDTGG